MKIQCRQQDLKTGLSIVGRAVPTRAAVPMVQNVLIEAQEGQLQLSATDLEIQIKTAVDAVVKDTGALAVPARLLTDVVNSFEGDSMEMDTEDFVLRIGQARSQANINGADPGEFPPAHVMQEPVAVLMNSAEFRRYIERVAIAAASEDTSPVLTGVHLKIDSGNLVMAAADGFRLAVQRGNLAEDQENEISAVVPARTIAEVRRILAVSKAEQIKVNFSSEMGQVEFAPEAGKGTRLVSQLLQGTFPSYEQLVPSEWTSRATFNRQEMLQCVKSAAIFARDGSSIVRMELEAKNDGTGVFNVSGMSEEVGDNCGRVDASLLEGEGGRIAFNSRYLVDVLGALDSEQVEFEMNSGSSPGVFRIQGDDTYVQVVMPMSVQW